MPVMIAAIVAYFTVAFMFNRGERFVELRTSGLTMMGLGIMLVALHGIFQGIGSTGTDRTGDVLAVSLVLSGAGLSWMVLYWFLAAVTALWPAVPADVADDLTSNRR